jgi:predicted permease
MRQLLRRVGYIIRRRRFEAELAEEMAVHQAMKEAELQSRGAEPKDAASAARCALGSMALARDHVRDVWLWPWFQDLIQDLRYAGRGLRRNPGFSAVAILTLALGIGANTALFSIVDAVLLKLLPVQDPGRLVVLSLRDVRGERLAEVSYPLFSELRARNHTLADAFAATRGRNPMELRLPGLTDSQPAQVIMVSGNMFEALGVHARLGRMISTADDQRPGGQAVAVLSESFWKNHFSSSSSALGAIITVNDVALTIVGVAPPEFFGTAVGEMPDIWVPATMQPQLLPPANFLETASVDWLVPMARLRPGATLSQARADLDGVLQQVQQDWKGTANGQGLPEQPTVVVAPGSRGFSALRERFTRPLLILMGVVGLVLLVTCVNIATLLLTRAASRQREIVVRVALGASRQRLVRHLITESLLLAALGGLAGLLLAFWGTHALLPLLADRSGTLSLALGVDRRLLVFTVLVSVATGLVFGVIPAMHATRRSEGWRLAGARTGTRRRLGNILVVCQIALSLMLVAGAGLFLRSLQNLRAVDAGFDREHLLLLRVDVAATGYEGAQRAGLNRRLLAAVGGVPGVRSVSQSGVGLMQGRSRICCITVPGYVPALGERMAIRTNDVSPDYFSTVGMTVSAGRSFDERDSAATVRPAIVNEAFVRHYFGGGAAVGRSFGFEPDRLMEIIGVVRDAHYDGFREPAVPLAFFPRREDGRLQSLEVRAEGDPALLAAAVRRAVAAADAHVRVPEVITMHRLVESSLAQELLLARVSSTFGFLALGLACLGIYGVMAFRVARRTSEIGIRMALGATPWKVLQMVFGESARLVLGGIVVGLPAALAATRLIASQLFGVGPADPATLGGSALVMAALAGLAGFLPARRATCVDPVTALRSE